MTEQTSPTRLDSIKLKLEKIVGKRLAYPVLCAVPILLAIGIFAALKAMQTPPTQNDLSEQARLVRVIEAPVARVVPRAIGYGIVEPEIEWKAMAEVQGTVIYKNPNLKAGAVLPEGTEVLQIDPTDYELAVSRLEASLKAAQVKLSENQVREDNIKASLKIEEEALKLASDNLIRKRKLHKAGSVSKANLDAEERNYLSQQRAVQSQRNSLALIPVERAALEADLQRTQTQLEEAKRNLARTLISLPFDARIGSVDVEEKQVAMMGQMLLMADSIDVAEIKAQLPIEKFIGLVQPRSAEPLRAQAMFTGSDDSNETIREYGLKAKVRFRSGTYAAQWDASFSRIADSIDPQTRTVGVVVTVEDPLSRQNYGKKSQLTKNMYVEVELQAASVGERIVVPRNAIHDGAVYILTSENRLEVRPVKVGYQSGNFAVIESGLSEGEQLIVTDLIPAIPNMLLKSQEDLDTLTSLLNEAEGKGAIR